MLAIRYTGFRDATVEADTVGEGTEPDHRATDDPDAAGPPPPEAHHVIDDHRELPGLLGVA
jgi:hypothetical protein